MILVKSIKELRTQVELWKNEGKSIGFVPTMGYLHEGHGSLISKAKSQNDKVIVSIFVNPTQFGPNEDLDKYPRDLENDKKVVSSNGGDLIFAPEVKEMYPSEIYTFVNTSVLDNNLCGIKRPGHFRGVCTVVSKLFNIVKPHRAYFGKKDYQQLAIIRKMVEDLNFDVEIIGCEIIRSDKGLALSSRNSYLTDIEKEESLVLNRTLNMLKEKIKSGITNVNELVKIGEENILTEKSTKVDYLKIVDINTMEDVVEVDRNVLIALAVYINEKVRLIDNIEIIKE
ncbi:MAG: pantoate--beta-alanine ligase [Fusobacteriaceae bacterium]|nr:pantoate--beta-alanine ligase [Fusobacteriaceae bacterium]MBN2837602.1 pantoate--beta-alanine ligase [Fusobacteriaceae bacterium]